MDLEEIDFVSKLLTIRQGWGRNFFVSCLLFLSPEDLKACRLVNTTWDEVIKGGLWGNKSARKRLEEKLGERWKSANPEAVKLGSVPERVQDIFCNNKHIFCGIDGGKVKVYTVTDGQWLRDLESSVEDLMDLNIGRICGDESIMAARLEGRAVTVWSIKEEMGRVYFFDVRNYNGMERSYVEDVKVSGNYVIVLLSGRDSKHPGSTYQLVVLHEGEQHTWENKILESFSTPGWAKLAVDKDWWAIVGKERNRRDILKVKFWKEGLFRRDIDLLGVSADYEITYVAMVSPFLIVGVQDWSVGSETFLIKVFELASDKLMEEPDTSAPLIKTVHFPGFTAGKFLYIGLVFGCLLLPFDENHEPSLVVFEKTALLDSATLPEQTEGNRIPLLLHHSPVFGMNTTSIFFIQRPALGTEDRARNFLCEKDFWMCGNIVG